MATVLSINIAVEYSDLDDDSDFDKNDYSNWSLQFQKEGGQLGYHMEVCKEHMWSRHQHSGIIL